MIKTRENIKRALDGAASPAVLWSAGKDSQLLLALAREVRPDIAIIWFRSGSNEAFARRMIMQWDLDVWSWQPADVYVVPNDNGLTLVREQSFGQHRFPVLLDVEAGSGCIADVLPERTPRIFPHFNVILSGYKDTDYHWSLGGSGFCPPDGWVLGWSKVYAPLRHLTDADVWQAIRETGTPYDTNRYDEGGSDPDCIAACTQCLQPGIGQVFCPKAQREINRVAWNPQESLRAFRSRFGFKENSNDPR